MATLASKKRTLLLVLVLFLLFPSPSLSAAASLSSCSPQDRAALLLIASIPTIPSSSASPAPVWQGDDCCSWEGVFCDDNNSRVIGVFYSPYLQHFPQSVCDLPMLQHIALSIVTHSSNSSLHIPPCICSLQHLSELSFASRPLESLQFKSLQPNRATTFLLPDCICKLSNLTGLYLGGLETHNIPPCLCTLQHLNSVALIISDLRVLSCLTASTTSITVLDLIVVFDDSSPHLLSQFFRLLCSFTALSDLFLFFFGLPPNDVIGRHLNSFFVCASSPSLSSFAIFFDQQPSTPSAILPSSLCELQQLTSFSFQGSLVDIPECIANLTNLTHLDLSSNSLTGSIPSSFYQLSKLRYLNLRANNFSGSLPKELMKLANLESLDLSQNSFHGLIPAEWETLHQLSDLALSNNQLRIDHIPDFIFRLSLSTLELASSILGHHSLPCAQLLLINQSLLFLDLSGNALKLDVLQCFARNAFPKLSSLSLSGNPLQGALPPHFISSLKSIASLNLSSCQLSGPIPGSFFQALTSLTVLDLSNNQFSGHVPPELGNLLLLVTLDLSKNQFTGPVPTELGNLLLLRTLDLSKNQFTGPVPTELGNVSFLQYLDLSNNSFTGQIPPSLGRCKFLRWIKFGGNRLSGEIPYQLGNLYFLQFLHLLDNQLIGEIPSSLYNCTHLLLLDLSNNQVRGSLETSALRQLTALRVLVLRFNLLNGSIPSWIGDFSDALQVIDLSHNLLSGFVPQHMRLPAFKGEVPSATKRIYYFSSAAYGTHSASAPFGILSRLRTLPSSGTLYANIRIVVKNYPESLSYIRADEFTLDLSSNNLSGTIPSQLGDLSAMRSLNLSSNRLSGPISQSLSKLRALESLDLSFNNLTGCIPPDFSQLHFLGAFNVSYNARLSGRIPSSPQLEVAESYLGDSELCGFPTPRECSARSGGTEAAPEFSRKKESSRWRA